MLVNGNLGVGVAVAGAFSLVRFRSVPGNSREIASVFLAMAVGLATGMGYVAIGGLLVCIVGIVMLLVANLPVGRMNQMMRDLKVTIPENLDYEGIFDDLFAEYTTRNELLMSEIIIEASPEAEFLMSLKHFQLKQHLQRLCRKPKTQKPGKFFLQQLPYLK